MNPLQREAIAITKELGNVVFIGAVAVLSYLGWRHRATRDIDFAMATKLTKEELDQRGYRTFIEGRKEVTYSPRGFKVDIYTNDINEIPIHTVVATAKEIFIKNDKITMACLEVMLVSKLRAARPQDIEDFSRLCETNSKDVDWNVLNNMATQVEVSRIRESIRALAR